MAPALQVILKVFDFSLLSIHGGNWLPVQHKPAYKLAYKPALDTLNYLPLLFLRAGHQPLSDVITLLVGQNLFKPCSFKLPFTVFQLLQWPKNTSCGPSATESIAYRDPQVLCSETYSLFSETTLPTLLLPAGGWVQEG